MSAEQLSSAAAAALNDKKFRQTNIAAAVGCSDWFGGGLAPDHQLIFRIIYTHQSFKEVLVSILEEIARGIVDCKQKLAHGERFAGCANVEFNRVVFVHPQGLIKDPNRPSYDFLGGRPIRLRGID
jgi:hypothetical protein